MTVGRHTVRALSQEVWSSGLADAYPARELASPGNLRSVSLTGQCRQRSGREYCNVSGPDCLAPSEGENASARAECFRCGLAVCTECSSRRRIDYLRQRITARVCDYCLENETDGEAKVLLRSYHRAGYPRVTLAMTRAEIAGRRRAHREDVT